MNLPNISRLNTWERFEQGVIKIFIEALLILLKKNNLPNSENELNRKLYFCLLEANHKLYQNGIGGFNSPPFYEAQNPPDPEINQITIREKKRPDFYWGYIDHSEIDSHKSARHFVVECKRLGKPERFDWIFNQNYINNGIKRFILCEWGYSKNEKSGAMIGYIQNMKFEEIFNEVNETAKQVNIPKLNYPNNGWQKKGVSQLQHELTRTFQPSPFTLKHLWVDLRK